MLLEIILIEDIYPDEKNPRKDFGDIKALAKSFELNKLYPGEPVNPIVVVRDGGIYKIVDGERRYRAMKRNKLSSCHAVVCDDMDEANAQIAMLPTNDKQPLTPIEISRGVQQQLLLGVDPETIEKSARLKKGQASKIATVRALVDDAAEDMTLDRILAIEEFASDLEAVEKLTYCKENEWERIVTEIRQEKKNAQKWKEIEQSLAYYKIPVVEEHDAEHTQYIGNCLSAEQLGVRVTDTNYDVAYAWQAVKSDYRVCIDLYQIPNEDEEIDPEAEARKQAITELEYKLEDARNSHVSFVMDHAGSLSEIPTVAEALWNTAFSKNEYDKPNGSISKFEELIGYEISRDLNLAWIAYAYMEAENDLVDWMAKYLINGSAKEYYTHHAVSQIEWIDCLKKDGYILDEIDDEIVEWCAGYLADEEVDNGQDQ